MEDAKAGGFHCECILPAVYTKFPVKRNAKQISVLWNYDYWCYKLPLKKTYLNNIKNANDYINSKIYQMY